MVVHRVRRTIWVARLQIMVVRDKRRSRMASGVARLSPADQSCRLPANILIGFSHPKARYFLVATRKYPKKRVPGSAAAHPAAALAHELDSGGPPKGHPCPCGGRTRSLSCPCGPALRLHAGLGLTKGAKKTKRPVPAQLRLPPLGAWLGERRPKHQRRHF
jgi:hypothetical protein